MRLPDRLARLRTRLRGLDDRLLPAPRTAGAAPAWVLGAVLLAFPLAVFALVLAASGDPDVRRLCVLPVAAFLGLAAALLRWQRRARR